MTANKFRANFFLQVVLSCLVANVDNARILGAFFMPSISHQVVYQPIWKELSLRGHQVTVITTDPLNDPTLTNLTEIDISFTYDVFRSLNPQEKLNKNLPLTQMMKEMFTVMTELLRAPLDHPEIQALLNDKTKEFDLFMVEFMQPIICGFSHRFKAPMIGVSSLGTFVPGHDAVGNPTHPVVYPELMIPFTDNDLNFWDRLYSVYFEIWWRYHWKHDFLPYQDKIAKQYFGEDMPPLLDIWNNVSMLFLNTNPFLHPQRPNVPAVVQLGNMHIKPKKPLPADLKKELDAAKNGAIYFSLGSNVRSANLPIELRNTIMAGLAKLPYTIFWKWEDDDLPGKPDNVITRKWFPQQDVLGHPNIKGFVTQGGLQSMEEAINNKVPMVVIPFFGDQPRNALQLSKLGLGVILEFSTLTSQQLVDAIKEIVENRTLREKIVKASEISVDQPMTGLEKAVWWTEYVLRHNGARHLRSPAVDMPWYKYYLIDVISFVAICVILTLYIGCKVICFLTKSPKHKKSKMS